MKTNNKLYRALFTAAMVCMLIISCTDEFEEINTNPNEQVVGSNAGILLGAQLTAAGQLVDNIRSFNRGLSKWTQQYTNTLVTDQFVPINSRQIFNDFWVYQLMVVRAIPATERILDYTDDGTQPNYRAAALVTKAWIYQNLTEFWGPVPFSDAQFGEKSEEEQFNRPKLDSQEEIFKGVLLLLEEANSTFDLSGDPATAIDASSDAFAQGDVGKWQKFANSLRLRILMRMSDADPEFAKAGIESIYTNIGANPIMESNTDNFGVTFEADPSGGYPDPFDRYVLDNGFAPLASSGMLNILGNRLDPRMKELFSPAPAYLDAETYIGVPPAFDPDSDFIGVARDSVSSLSPKFTTSQQRPIMTYSEVLFIASEAALEGINVGISSEDAYEAGIIANMNELGDIAESEISEYLEGSLVAYDESNALEQIITQRYIAQFGQSANTFAMIRRTGLPELDFFSYGSNAEFGYPVRMRYPPNFENFNKVNFDKALEGVNFIGSNFGDQLWFAQNAPMVKMNPVKPSGPITFSY